MILLVEDNADDTALTTHALRKMGVLDEIIVLDDGVKTINWIDAMTAPPTAVLLDLSLPGINGIELLRYFKSTLETWDIPIIILTGSESERDKISASEVDGNGYIIKPLTLDKFIPALSVVGVGWRLERKVRQ